MTLVYFKRFSEDFSHLPCLLKSALFHYSETTRYNLDVTTPPFNNLLRLPRSSIALKRNVPLCDCIFWCSPTGRQTIRRSARSHAYPKRNSRPFRVPQHESKPSFQIIVPQNRCILRDIVFAITNN